MAFSSSLFQFSSLVYLTVQLLVLSDFARTTGAAVLENVCLKTRDPRLCLTYLTSDARSKGASVEQLAQITIDKMESNADYTTQYTIHNLYVSAKDPKLKNLYGSCEEFYMDALDALDAAYDLLPRKRYDQLKVNGGIVSSSASRCEQIFGGKSPFADVSIALEVLGDALAVISEDLKMTVA